MSGPQKIDYSVVIPVFNAGRSLPLLYPRLAKVLRTVGKNSEVIFVDDGSRDASWEILKGIQKDNGPVKIIQLMRNYGQHRALMCGLSYAQGEYLITMDDDLQYPPEEIFSLIRKLETSSADAVIGAPIRKNHSLFKRIGGRMFNWLYSLILNKPGNLRVGSFCIIRRKVVDQMIQEETANPQLNALLLNATLNVVNQPVRHEKRRFGRSSYSLTRLLTLGYDLVINYSALPLKVVGFIGLASSLFGFFGLLYFLSGTFLGTFRFPLRTPLVLLILLMNGLTLFSFGIVGEYLSRVLREARHEEQFKIRRVIGGEEIK